jgi:hypothetical protein
VKFAALILIAAAASIAFSRRRPAAPRNLQELARWTPDSPNAH